MTKLLELPPSAYEKAEERYQSLGQWFDRKESKISAYNPHIFPQGSFRLGTAIRPLNESDEYDLDLACKLRDGISKGNYTQKDLKELIGSELKAYRKAHNIENKLEPKHRCWRLEYRDALNFHMDIVPCIPADEDRQKIILASMQRIEPDERIAQLISQTTVSITDDRHSGYEDICDDWNISNPEGYAKWFEHRMIMGMQQEAVALMRAQVDDVPLYKERTPLQQVIQLLKRHRDHWSRDNPDTKPISIIITTLAARAYDGEVDIIDALDNILGKMGGLVQPAKPRVPNPVDPAEDFADRWDTPEGNSLKLEKWFNLWLFQAKKDFEHLTPTTDPKFLCEHIKGSFSLQINQSNLKAQLGIGAASIITSSKTHTIDPNNTPKPYGGNKQ